MSCTVLSCTCLSFVFLFRFSTFVFFFSFDFLPPSFYLPTSPHIANPLTYRRTLGHIGPRRRKATSRHRNSTNAPAGNTGLACRQSQDGQHFCVCGISRKRREVGEEESRGDKGSRSSEVEEERKRRNKKTEATETGNNAVNCQRGDRPNKKATPGRKVVREKRN